MLAKLLGAPRASRVESRRQQPTFRQSFRSPGNSYGSAKRASRSFGHSKQQSLLRSSGGNEAATVTTVEPSAPQVTVKISQLQASDSLGLTWHEDGEVSLRVWAPHAVFVYLQLKNSRKEIPCTREGDTWAVRLERGAISQGDAYQFLIQAQDGRMLERRDPYARYTDYKSCWCFADDGSKFDWTPWDLPAFESYMIYELHMGSFTPEGTFVAAAEKLKHVADLGFTAVQLMPIIEHSDQWGYNPRQLMALHQEYGTPEEFRMFVDTAHKLGLGVVIDVVLHHGAVDGNALWEFDGWGPDWNGGIYHQGGADTEWGRGFAFWKVEVMDMLYSACAMYLVDYRCDGLRFDSANDLPHEAIQSLTWRLRQDFPGRLMSAEVTPENPQAVHELGFDSLWVHSGYFDIIQQHRALGRGHHGGGDWEAGWDLPRLRTAMALHPGFTAPTQCIKYFLGSHDQVGCKNGGAWYADYEMIGGQHRYAVDHYGGGRHDGHAMSTARLWYAANVGAAGLVMSFMGTEFAQCGWWNNDEHHSLNWDFAEDEIGQQLMAMFTQVNNLRKEYGALRHGWANILHEDRPNGVVGFERVHEGEDKVLVVVNAGQSHWQSGEYGVWVGDDGSFEEIFSSQAKEFGGWDFHSNSGNVLKAHEGTLYINLPPSCTLMFKSVMG